MNFYRRILLGNNLHLRIILQVWILTSENPNNLQRTCRQNHVQTSSKYIKAQRKQ